MDPKIKEYIVDLVLATRRPEDYGIKGLKEYLRYGASPRASIYLNEAARAHAFLRHRGYVIPEDVKAVGMDVLRHRILLSYEAEAENLTAEDLLKRLFDSVAVP
jgi:MoxR-like ATPase